jgi:small subunit ribosomal protein S21
LTLKQGNYFWHHILYKKGGDLVPTVTAKETEPFDILLKRFKKKCEKAAILSEIKKHQAYEKPSVKKKREDNVSRRKMIKVQRKMQRFMK